MRSFVFSSFPDFSDNSLFLFEKMLELKVPGKYIWLYKDDSDVKFFKKNYQNILSEKSSLKIIKKNSVRGLIYYFCADYIFTTHGMFEQFPLIFKQKKINLWHGMPLKKIANYDKHNVTSFQISKSISNGEIFDEVISKAFQIDDSSILKIGSPRNDKLFCENIFSFFEIFKNDNKTVIWMPTYRKSIVGDVREDGEYIDNQIAFMNYDDLVVISKMFQERSMNLFIKLHPMDVLNNNSFFINKINELNNIKIETIQSEWLGNKTVYEVLNGTISLITDYSSIYFDYLLLKKPIAILSGDEKEYGESRGFIKEIFDNLSGIKIQNIIDFESFLNILIDDKKIVKSVDNLRSAREKFQTYDKKGENSKYILNKLKIY